MSKMKSLFLFLIVAVYTSVCLAQDVIVKKDGSVIHAKVLTVEESLITYKAWDNQEGPASTINKKNDLAINYENGKKDVFSNSDDITVTDNQSNLSQQQLEYAITSATRKSTAGRGKIIAGGCILGLIGIPNIITGIVCVCNDAYKLGGTCLGVGAFVTGLGWGLVSSGKNEREYYAIHHSSIRMGEFAVGKCVVSPSVDVFSDDITKRKSLGGGLCFQF